MLVLPKPPQIESCGKVIHEKITDEKVTDEKVTDEKVTDEKVTDEKAANEVANETPPGAPTSTFSSSSSTSASSSSLCGEFHSYSSSENLDSSRPRVTANLYILSGGAAQSWIASLQPMYEAKHNIRIHATFGAVGAMKQLLLEGAPCDVLILSRALINELRLSGHVEARSDQDIAVVKTGLAVKAGRELPHVNTSESLKQLLMQASGVFIADPKLATAGIHFMKVITELGLADVVKKKLHTFPNGHTAMRALADSKDIDGLGCTQETEVKFTGGVQWAGELPADWELNTTYTIGLRSNSDKQLLFKDLTMQLLLLNQ